MVDMVDMAVSTFKVRIRVLLRRLEVCPKRGRLPVERSPA
jgi:hypothetical protein